MMSKPVLFLGHGASGTAASMRPFVRALAPRGIEGVALDLPRNNPAKAVDVFRRALETQPKALIGGHSYGGRMASMLAAETPVTGLVLLSYPLHRPGHPDELRTDHWKQITSPVLMLSGESDPFARIDLLRRELKRLADVELVTYPGVGHGLVKQADDVSEEIVQFVARITGGSTRGR